MSDANKNDSNLNGQVVDAKVQKIVEMVREDAEDLEDNILKHNILSNP